MINTADMLAALLIGLAGSTHCIFMCGGIHGALVTSARQGSNYMPLFNLGRIASYTLFGLIVGSLGVALQSTHELLMPVAKIFAGLLLLAMAAYLGRWWSGLVVLEKIGAPIWSIMQPFARQLMPVRSAGGAIAAGAIWGWLPCGLVYSTLAWAMLADNPADAAARMFFFGLGTFPALLGTGFVAEKIARYLKSRVAKNLNALLLVGFALWTLLPAVMQLASGEGHHHGSHGSHSSHELTNHASPEHHEGHHESDMHHSATDDYPDPASAPHDTHHHTEH